MFESLSSRLQGIAERLRGKAKITEADLDVALREIRLALLEADVNFRVVKEFVGHVRERAVGTELLTGLNPGQQVVKIVHDELVATLGGDRHHLSLEKRPAVLMLVGLQGSGKTTTAAKLAVRLRKEGRRPLLVAADVYRPAAVDQLVQLGDQVGVEVHSRSVGTPALEVARSGLAGGAAAQPGRRAARHRRPAPRRRGDDGRAGANRRRGHTRRDAAHRGRHDRAGGGPRGGGLPRPTAVSGLVLTKMDGDKHKTPLYEKRV